MPSSLSDDLQQELQPHRICKVCDYLAALPSSDAQDWAAALADGSYTTSVLVRVLTKRGCSVSWSKVDQHRKLHEPG